MAATKKTTATKMTKDQMEAKMEAMMEMMAEMSKALEATNARALAAEAKNAELADELRKTPAQRKAEAKAKVEAEVQREAFIQRAVDKALADLHGAVAHRFYSERKGNGTQRLGELDYEVEEANWVYEKVLMESANPDREAARQAVAFVLPATEGGAKKPRAGKGSKSTGKRSSSRRNGADEMLQKLDAAGVAGFDLIPYSAGLPMWRKVQKDGKTVFAIQARSNDYAICTTAKKLAKANRTADKVSGGQSYLFVNLDELAELATAMA